MLRQYFLRPSLNLDVINERLDTVSVFVRPDNDSVLQTLVKILKNVGNMRATLINLRKGVSGTTKGRGGFSNSVWKSIRAVSFSNFALQPLQLLSAFSQFTFHALKIKDTLQDLSEGDNLAIRAKVS